MRRTIALVELVPRALVPPTATRMRVSVTGYFSCKDMYEKTFYKYQVKVSNGDLEWTVAKRYSQFNELAVALGEAWRSGLTKARQKGLRPLPKIPGKRYLGSTKVSFLRQRQAELQKYLRLLTVHPWASEQAPFLSFTGMLSDTRNQSKAAGRHVIHVSRLEDFAQPGDVVLFKSSNTMSGLQRVATRSEWDHCGVVVELRRHRLHLLESTGDGVGCYPLAGRIRAYAIEFAQYMTIRRLRGPRRRKFRTALREFTASVNGAKYSLGIKKLLTKQTFEASKGSGFFCSELVAACWQESGVMHGDKAPNSYWPTDFSEGGKAEAALKDGYRLEGAVLIDTRVVEVARATNKEGEES